MCASATKRQAAKCRSKLKSKNRHLCLGGFLRKCVDQLCSACAQPPLEAKTGKLKRWMWWRRRYADGDTSANLRLERNSWSNEWWAIKWEFLCVADKRLWVWAPTWMLTNTLLTIASCTRYVFLLVHRYVCLLVFVYVEIHIHSLP